MTRSAEAALALYLDRLCLRSPLGDDERAALFDLPSKAQVVGVERDFVRIGDRVEHACLVVDGLVARFAQIRSGTRSFVALHIPGDMADLHSVVAPEVTWALHALTATTILRIPHTAIRTIADRYPALARAFWRDCVVDATVLAQWTVNISRKDALARVAHLLAEMNARYGAIGLKADKTFPFPITQTDLADAVGLTSVHLNRVLGRLRDNALAIKRVDSVTIENAPGLARIGEFDPAYLQLMRDERPDSR